MSPASSRTATRAMDSDHFPFWYRVIDRFGVPVAALMFVAACVWFGGRYTLVEIIRPIAERHIEFVDEVEKGQRAHTDALKTLTGAIENQNTLLKQQGELLREALSDRQARGTP